MCLLDTYCNIPDKLIYFKMSVKHEIREFIILSCKDLAIMYIKIQVSIIPHLSLSLNILLTVNFYCRVIGFPQCYS